MSFEIYFDESNKIDKLEGDYSYYGIIGWHYSDRKEFDNFMNNNKIFQELHFTEFKLDKVENYYEAIVFALNKINANFYIVNKNEAFRTASKIGIHEDMLRKLFYIKIPERLIYGMTRSVDEYKDIDIFIDQSDEYGKKEDGIVCDKEFTNKLIQLCSNDNHNKNRLVEAHLNKLINHIQLPDTLKSQLNAQALYRGLNYSIRKVKQCNSKDSKSLQVIDVILGMIKFLFEEEYLEPNPLMPKHKMDEIMDSCLNLEDKEFFRSCYKFKEFKKTGEQKYELKIGLHLNDRKRLVCINKQIHSYSQKSIQKSEFIYRLLKEDFTFNKICDFKIFVWEDDEILKELNHDINKNFKEVIRQDLSRYIAKFLKFKVLYDETNKLEILKIHKTQVLANGTSLPKESDFRKALGFGTGLKQLIRRYLQELRIETEKN